jgi:hypothetical protein
MRVARRDDPRFVRRAVPAEQLVLPARRPVKPRRSDLPWEDYEPGWFGLERDRLPGPPTLVFAYGSNLDERQMAHRCPGASVVRPAVLHNVRLAFAGHSVIRQGAVATLRLDRGNYVPGLIWSVPERDLWRLDSYEGAPGSYFRALARVTPLGWSSGTMETQTYSQRPEAPEALPSKFYLAQIVCAYRRLGFNERPLRQAVGYRA